MARAAVESIEKRRRLYLHSPKLLTAVGLSENCPKNCVDNPNLVRKIAWQCLCGSDFHSTARIIKYCLINVEHEINKKK
jgi:hypothetical protein